MSLNESIDELRHSLCVNCVRPLSEAGAFAIKPLVVHRNFHWSNCRRGANSRSLLYCQTRNQNLSARSSLNPTHPSCGFSPGSCDSSSPAPPVSAPAAGGDSADPELLIAYFRRLLASETDNTGRPPRWEAVASASGLSDESLGEVRSVNSQTRLLIREQFVQFDGLVDEAEFLR